MAYVNKSDIYKLFDESNGVIRLHIADVDMLPTADVKEVKRGHWIVSKTEHGWNCCEYPAEYTCSECGRVNPHEETFCPECGADMRGDTDG